MEKELQEIVELYRIGGITNYDVVLSYLSMLDHMGAAKQLSDIFDAECATLADFLIQLIEKKQISLSQYETYVERITDEGFKVYEDYVPSEECE